MNVHTWEVWLVAARFGLPLLPIGGGIFALMFQKVFYASAGFAVYLQQFIAVDIGHHIFQ